MVVWTPSEGELTIYREGNKVGSAFCSASMARQYIQHGCLGYLVYVVDTQVEGRVLGSYVLVVREFLDVFLKDLPGVPHVRQVDFWIDRIPNASPIAKYRLTPPEKQELSS